MPSAEGPHRISEAVQAFALQGRFPDDVSSLPPVTGTDLDPSIQALGKLRTDLEGDIHTINQETKEDVSSWVRNAKALQEDIIRSKAIANDIVRQSEAPDVSGEAIQDAEDKAEFLNREVQYSRQLYDVLRGIQHVNQLLGEVEQARNERRVLDSLRYLEKSWAALDDVGVSRSCRIMKLLDHRTFELKSDVHEVFDHIWKELVQVDTDAGTLAIHESVKDQRMTFDDAVVGLKAYKEVDERMEQLWRNLDAAIVGPRMSKGSASPPSVKSQGDVLELDGSSDTSVDALLSDLDTVIGFLAQRLPSELIAPLCSFMMNELIPKLIHQWLDPAVPSSLTNMTEFQSMIQRAEEFCYSLEKHGFSGYQELSDWVKKAPTIWLGKCRETTLSTVRSKLTRGLGASKQVEKVEKHMVSVSEGKELATTGAGASAETNDWGDDWGDAWDEDHEQAAGNENPAREGSAKAEAVVEDDGADAWGWDDEDDKHKEEPQHGAEPSAEDDGADAWGWGDEDNENELPKPKAHAAPKKGGTATNRPAGEQTRELILKETYHISSMPEPVMELISSILEDGAALTQPGDEYAHVAATAPGLFGLPTFVLALFRAISPYYYSLDVGGNMFLYNDAMYLAEKLNDFSAWWKQRSDLTPRAQAMLRLDNDVKSLQGFANRSYAGEMNVQRTILRDLIGGAHSILQHDEMEAAVESGVARIRAMAATWEPVLARSVWSQAVGSLADALATKLITDVLDASSIGQDEAYNIAKLIASATELDDLFLPSKLAASGGGGVGREGNDGGEDSAEVPATAQYAPNWLRLKFLSEVLQSNLNEVRYLWVESELSLYFSAGEVVDLIRASFEDNARTRETIREVQAKRASLE